MSYPIPLGRYDQIRMATAPSPPGGASSGSVIGEENPGRWEILGVASTGNTVMMVFGRVKMGKDMHKIEGDPNFV